MEDMGQKITLNFKLLTGGTFTVNVNSDISVELLRKIVSKKLKISKDRICLMNSERELQDGTLQDNGIVNGSKIIVTPKSETGLAQRTENTVMQALESLNDNQVNDFLSGKSPLNLSVRLGDHMMLIQLQLSTLSPSQQNSLKQKVANAAALKQQASSRSIINCTSHKSYGHSSTTESPKSPNDNADEFLPEKAKKLKTDKQDDDSRSPIKSLSSMVSNPLTTTVQNMNQSNNKFWAPSVDPIAANLTSCLCKRLNINCNNNCGQRSEPTEDEPCCSYSNNVIPTPNPIPFHQRPSTSFAFKPEAPSAPVSQIISEPSAEQQLLTNDNPALAEASRNLTQTLRKLSKRVFTTSVSTADNSTRKTIANSTQSAPTAGSSGAVIESMKHHGKGIYSGTFSGTLNPALQDKNGRPKRDISTIIHILNDLLSATPQCARSGAKIFFEPTQSSTGSTSKFIKMKKQSNSRTSCTRCVPTVLPPFQQKCVYGQCNGHSKTDMRSPRKNLSHLIPSTSTDVRDDCEGCNQTMVNRRLEIENMKTKSKLDQLKLVMQQKKEKREARKMKIAPYNSQKGNFSSSLNQPVSATVSIPLLSSSTLLNEGLLMPAKLPEAQNHLNHTSTETSSSAMAIATSISSGNSELENHLEEVETVA